MVGASGLDGEPALPRAMLVSREETEHVPILTQTDLVTTASAILGMTGYVLKQHVQVIVLCLI